MDSMTAFISIPLPTAQEYEKLASYFEVDTQGEFTDQGSKDLNTVFPDMQGRLFWSSSVNPNKAPYLFDSLFGHVSYFFGFGINAGDKFSVRCAGR